MKLIVEVPKDEYEECKMQVEMIRKEGVLVESLSLASKIHIANGTPLDDIRQEITEKIEIYTHEFAFDDSPVDYGRRSGLNIALKIIDRHIGKRGE